LTASSSVPAPPPFVFAAIVDPAVLRRALPGCAALDPMGRDTFDATFTLDFAGRKDTYTGRFGIRDQVPSDSLRLTFESATPAGRVAGSVALRLTADGGATHVVCEIDVKFPAVPATEPRLLEGAARRLAADFFVHLTREI
jgi:hypothetical protein